MFFSILFNPETRNYVGFTFWFSPPPFWSFFSLIWRVECCLLGSKIIQMYTVVGCVIIVCIRKSFQPLKVLYFLIFLFGKLFGSIGTTAFRTVDYTFESCSIDNTMRSIMIRISSLLLGQDQRLVLIFNQKNRFHP